MEELLACALLYQAGLFPAGPYRETLDFLFRDDPEDPLLLELEWTAKDMLQKQQPFWSLSYADDPMSWGDETQSRELYRDMLAFYQRKTALSGDHLG